MCNARPTFCGATYNDIFSSSSSSSSPHLPVIIIFFFPHRTTLQYFLPPAQTKSRKHHQPCVPYSCIPRHPNLLRYSVSKPCMIYHPCQVWTSFLPAHLVTCLLDARTVWGTPNSKGNPRAKNLTKGTPLSKWKRIICGLMWCLGFFFRVYKILETKWNK